MKTNHRATMRKPQPWPWPGDIAHCCYCGRLLLPPHKTTGPEHCPAHAAIPLDVGYRPVIQSEQREEA
jgi:hypothetical protein